MTRYCYDLEFLEDGRTIELISIGIAADDGREYYAVNREMTWNRVLAHDWLRANVVPQLPTIMLHQHNGAPTGVPVLKLDDPAVKYRERIAADVREFIQAGSTDSAKNELWAYFGAYDHVGLCQLWGRMIDLPAGVPMYTRDLQQEAARLGIVLKRLVPQDPGEHHALADARWNLAALRYLDTLGA